MKHTPGPWDITTDTLDPHDAYWIQRGRKTIARLFRVRFTIAEFRANARLIAAALIAVVVWCGCYDNI